MSPIKSLLSLRAPGYWLPGSLRSSATTGSCSIKSRSFLLVFLLLALALPASAAPFDFSPAQGRFAELHSCEVFAGPCVINSEVDQAGNYQFRVWQFDAGTLHGVPMKGLTVALLEMSNDNLADHGNASAAVAYLPPNLTPDQHTALVAWAQKNTAAILDPTRIKIAPVQATFSGRQVSFSAGNEISFFGAAAVACNIGGCAEMLWYQPRVASTSFGVDQLGESRIIEPLLSLRWMDHGRKTLFVGRFGDQEIALPELCGAPATASL